MNLRRRSMAKVLLVEDEVNIRKIIAYELKNANHEVVECGDGKQALQEALQQEFDVMIIDWMLPYMSGVEIVKALRDQHVDSIIIMLTARDDEEDVLYAFEQGVDDYMSKPFSSRELLARIHAHLRRHKKVDTTVVTLGNLRIDMNRREASILNQVMNITKKEFDLLGYFIKNQDIVLSRDNILNEVWGFDYDGDTRIVDVHVFKLRSKLEGSNLHIKSSRGVGYILEQIKNA